jgi:hypothetical protein
MKPAKYVITHSVNGTTLTLTINGTQGDSIQVVITPTIPNGTQTATVGSDGCTFTFTNIPSGTFTATVTDTTTNPPKVLGSVNFTIS